MKKKQKERSNTFSRSINNTCRWHPDPSLQGCSNVYCVVPNATEMKRTKAFVVPRLPVVVYKTNVSLTCESGKLLFLEFLLLLCGLGSLYQVIRLSLFFLMLGKICII